MTTPMKLIVAILAILLIGAGFYMFDWSDKWARKKAAQDQLDQKQSELAALQEAIKELPKLQQQVLEKEAELNRVINQRVSSESAETLVGNYLQEVERLVVEQQRVTGDYSFHIKSISPGTQQATGAPGAQATGPDTPEALSAFQTRVFTMSMEGKYSTIVDFLYQLGAMKLDRLVTINSIRLGKAGGQDGSPTLSIDMPITAYLKQGSN